MALEEAWSGVERHSASEVEGHVDRVHERRSAPPAADCLLLTQLCSAQEEEPPLSAREEAGLGDAGENVGGTSVDAILAGVPSMPSATVITPTPPEAEAGLCRFYFAPKASCK